MEKRDDPLSEGKSVALPLPHLIFKISTEASVSSRLYCRAYTAITFLRGAGRCLRAQVYACVVNAISSFLILLRVFLSRGKKKDAIFSFLFLLINGRRGRWRGGCLLSFSIRLIRMISFTVSVAWRLRDRCCLRII